MGGRLGTVRARQNHRACCSFHELETSAHADERTSWWSEDGGIVKTCGLSVGGHLHLPVGGKLKLPGHGHLVTQRADAE